MERFLQQLVEDAAEILGGRPVATLERIAKPGLARELLNERSADPLRALHEVVLRGRVDIDALTVENEQPAPSVLLMLVLLTFEDQPPRSAP
ncbi:MAG: hypothetical protein WBP81_00105 [Solirubrobacteraceae bacterium]